MPLKFTSCEDFLKNNTNSTEDKNKFYTTGREEGTCLQLLRIQLEILPKFLNWILYNSSVYTYDVSYLSETAFARNFSSISRP